MQRIPNSFQSTKLRQPTAGRDSCLKINECYIIFANSTIWHIPNRFYYEKPGTLVPNFAGTTQYPSKETILTHYAHIWVGLASSEASPYAWQIQFQRWVVNSVSQYLQDNFHQRKKVANFLPSFFSFLEHKCNGFKTSLLNHYFFFMYEL